MKKNLTFLLFILIFGQVANSKTYYVTSAGNDNNSGLSTSLAWKTLTKVSSFTGFVAGDMILFNRGEVFYGKLTINNNGSSGNPITFGAYGSGANPVISGFTSVTSWTNLGSNIWQSTNAVSTLTTANMVVINGVNTSRGRYPNSGYLTYQSFSGTTSITSSSLTGSPNWTGAEVVIRKQRFLIDRDPITSQSGGTLYYTSATTYSGQSGYGFFIQNDPRTLDQQNEWYYNPSTKKLQIYSTSSPSNVQISTIDTLVNIPHKNYLTFTNLAFQGSNQDAFTIMSSANVTIQNCSIDYSGKDAIWGASNGGASSANFVFKNSSINHTNNNAITLESEFTSAYIGYNTIKNTGLDPGMGGNASGNYGTLMGVQIQALSPTIEYNAIDSTGFNVIFYNQSNVLVRNNLITNFCTQKLDGAAIYSYVGAGVTPPTNQKLTNNIILNGIGDNAGTNATGNPIAHGIYLDDGNANVEVSFNTISNCSHSGIYIHNSNTLNVHDNVSYNNGVNQVLFSSFNTTSPVRNVNFKRNILVSQTSTQNTASFESVANDLGSFGTLDSNYYARPISDSTSLHYAINNYTTGGVITLAKWQSLSSEDIHSKKSPKTITSISSLSFNYNASSASVTVPLNGNYIDVKNVSYNGSITLAPYTSAILILNGALTNMPPTANAGANQTITLPTNIVTLSGSGTDPDGTISSYLWTEISGPNKGVITNASSASTTVTGLIQGVYQFQLVVTDNNNATGSSTVQITVNSASGTNSPPVANAGPDQTITLPTNSVTLSGSGTDADGTITSYKWAWVRGGSNTPTIVSPNSATTQVTGLLTGAYVFGLTVTDNNGATNTDLLTINVNPAVSNTPPVANAGPDQTITLPTNSVTLSGSGTDADGTITGYKWAWVRGGSNTPTIVSPNSATTQVTGLLAGAYVFGLTVTDNKGATNTDLLTINVLAAGTAAVDLSDNVISNQNSTSTGIDVKAYPNPFVDNITISINGGVQGPYKMILVDASGRILQAISDNKPSGLIQQSINTSQLPKGIYFLQVIQNSNRSVIKLEK